MNLDDSWYAVGVRVCGNGTDAENAYFSNIFFQLAILSTIFLIIKLSFRAFSAVWQIRKSRKRLLARMAWPIALLGGLVTLLDPRSGSALIESQFSAKVDTGLDEYRRMLGELRSDWILLFLETLPQFIIQVAYAVVASQNAHYQLSPAWYVATITTMIRLLSQLQEVIYLQLNFSKLKQLALRVESKIRRSSIVVNNNNANNLLAANVQRDNLRAYDENM